MSFTEQFHIRAPGAPQQGPYTYPQLKRLYDRDLISEDALYWREGMEEWRSITELCGAPMQERRRRLRIQRMLTALVILLLAACAAYLAPMIREGWKETSEHEYSREAAYWKARSYVREDLRGRRATVTFQPFDPAAVELTNGTDATVLLNGVVFGRDGTGAPGAWRVTLKFNPAGREWHLGGK